MDKYTLKAVGQLVVFSLACATAGFTMSAILEYFKPTPEQGVFAICAVVLAYTLYNLVKIQADILRSRDKLNK